MNQTTNTTAGIDLDAAQLDKLEALVRAADKAIPLMERIEATQELFRALTIATVLQLIQLARRSTSGSDFQDRVDIEKAGDSARKVSVRMEKASGSELAPDAGSARRFDVQSIDTPEFRKLCDAYHCAGQSDLEDAYDAIFQHVDEAMADLAHAWQDSQQAATCQPLADERALPPLPTAAMESWHVPGKPGHYYTIDQMREYARAALAHQSPSIDQQGGAAALMNADELAALRRFNETCEDGEGYGQWTVST